MSQFQSGPGFFPAIAVGGYQLELGSSDGTFVLFEPESEHEQANALAAALRAPEAAEVPEPTATDRLEEVLGEASSLTEHSQRCLRLFTEIAEGSRDPHAISDEIDALLALLGRLDREGKHKEALRLARDLAALLALLLRWLDLVQSLELALRTARALGDQGAEAWALHELGTLQLAAGDAISAADRLQEAVRLKEQIGGRGRCASRHNLDAARRDLADRATLERVQRRKLLRIVGAGAILVFLAGGGIALGTTTGSHKHVDGGAPSPQNPTTSVTGHPAAARLNLSTSVSGSGKITRDPGGISCGDGCWSYDAPTTVILKAEPDPGSAFDSWQGACAKTTSDTCTLKITGATTVSATFDQFYNLTVALTPVGSGTVNPSPEAVSCGDGCWRYPAGTIVTLKAVPTKDSGYFFSGWQGDCKGATGDSCTLTINGNTSVTAAFDHLR
jgi:Divergent InlB B-repeat domain